MQIILILIGLLTCSAKHGGARQQALDSEQRNSLRGQHFHQSHVGGNENDNPLDGRPDEDEYHPLHHWGTEEDIKSRGTKLKLVKCKVVDELKKLLDALDEVEITKYLTEQKIQRTESPYCEFGKQEHSYTEEYHRTQYGGHYQTYTFTSHHWKSLKGEHITDEAHHIPKRMVAVQDYLNDIVLNVNNLRILLTNVLKPSAFKTPPSSSEKQTF